MNRNLLLSLAGIATMAIAAPSSAACVGTCGTLGADGVVTASPDGGTYGYVTTTGGVSGVGLGLGSETTGSAYTTGNFTANAGDLLKFYFNFVTSDGAGYADYAWVNLGGDADLTLFTARTTPSGSTVPGFGMPAIAAGVTLNPSPVTIIGGAPNWSPVDFACYSTGCGYTGWIEMTYTVTTAGTYNLTFGVVNWADSAYQTGLAYDGAVIGDTPIPNPGVPEPATWAMLIAGFGLVGATMRRRRTVAA